MKFHTYVQVPNHAFLFLLGGIVADLRKRTSWRLSLPWFLGAIGFLFVLVMPWRPVFYDYFDIMAGMARVKYVGICWLAVAVFAFYEMPEHPLRRPFVFLGNASYSVYLLHHFAWLIAVKLMPTGFSPIWSFLFAIVVTLGLSGVVFRWIEKPAMGLGGKLAGRFT